MGRGGREQYGGWGWGGWGGGDGGQWQHPQGQGRGGHWHQGGGQGYEGWGHPPSSQGGRGGWAGNQVLNDGLSLDIVLTGIFGQCGNLSRQF